MVFGGRRLSERVAGANGWEDWGGSFRRGNTRDSGRESRTYRDRRNAQVALGRGGLAGPSERRLEKSENGPAIAAGNDGDIEMDCGSFTDGRLDACDQPIISHKTKE